MHIQGSANLLLVWRRAVWSYSLFNADASISVFVGHLDKKVDLVVRQFVTQAPHDLRELRRRHLHNPSHAPCTSHQVITHNRLTYNSRTHSINIKHYRSIRSKIVEPIVPDKTRQHKSRTALLLEVHPPGRDDQGLCWCQL